ncbi:VCBS repeat-containing protein [Rhodocyclus tenuis]|uniref:VCBS repeat-containing protein n=1 Tax=Rhodocyclus tenuis TaxID=1066 RepID=A0A840G708_RHOTE|nr:VCBS repeat-containing protein [Rhodocyclus tenuis]MBB4248143.1 hypothetical protein [Rhodocyclus tenuis]
MKIASAALQLKSTHFSEQRHEITESLRSWRGPRQTRGSDEGAASAASAAPANDPVKLSAQGRAASTQSSSALEDALDASENDPNLRLIRQLLVFLTGREPRVFDARDLSRGTTTSTPDAASDGSPTATTAASGSSSGSGNAPANGGGGVAYDRTETYSEIEQTQLSASGIVRTADGKEIAFSLSLSMSRSYQESSTTSLRMGDTRRTQDPLVVNFDGNAAQLSSQRFAFDLNADGESESINFVAPGSGFLALDRNADGRINNGSELFGGTTGNGFGELAKLDSDHNGWIDENDVAYEQLRVWSRDDNGDRLSTLREAGVGAISLAQISTPFALKDANNELLGQIRSSSVFLREDGKAGTIQQIDLTV